jgi:hypothetical protein
MKVHTATGLWTELSVSRWPYRSRLQIPLKRFLTILIPQVEVNHDMVRQGP